MARPGRPTPTVTELLLARERDTNPGLLFEGQRWSWANHVQECADRAALLRSLRRAGPFHIGVLLDNVPEFAFLLGGAALAGAVLVGLNTTRRGAALARDVRLADCQIVLTESRYVELLDDLDLGAARGRVLDIDSAAWHMSLYAHRHRPLEPVPAAPDDLLMLIFTSGTSGDPKAVRCTHGKIAEPGRMLAERFGLGPDDTVYVSMPMFHSNAIMAGWAVGLAAGAGIALRRRFSASGFLDDVRIYGATYANYVGKPLSYVLATEPRPDDADNPLRLVFGNEAAERDAAAFAERFGCRVVDAYGSTEGGIVLARPPDTPRGSLGRLGDGIAILDPQTARPCPPARFDADGRLLNPGEAVGELVNTTGAGAFAGYYRDSAADGCRIRNGMFWSGDLAYRDENDFCYFYGRTGDWLRVDGENLGTAPIERILLRHPDISEAAVYAVPDGAVGEAVMAAVVLRRGRRFDADAFADFLVAQKDLGAKQVPRFVRVANRLPRTPTHKVIKRTLMAHGVRCADAVWWREGPEPRYRPLTPDNTPIQLDGGTRHVRG
ncbi:MAG TPA: long-chain-fatty-acid--CoA ligase [Actinophytocola sp.]|uniref:long-chain-fatty-acid--CoA ligase n=1 Tax=Actinophytocola sp. TaxID=1872138 RepID=UPI002DDD4B91|nr:long-chain-fatty-acid--CoA ligase [Actinophytocola sp.]HEV2784408.1 long-chain-fatty-acid--CoA ligase [Actinophytocola sp.]